MHTKKYFYLFFISIFFFQATTTTVNALEKKDSNLPNQACLERACVKGADTVPHTIFAAAKRHFVPNDETSLNPEVIFNLINEYRAKLGLKPFEKDENLCTIAKSREPELMGEIFGGKGIHAGFRARHLPYWTTENMKYGGDENNVFNWWLSSPIHHRAIVSNSKYSCGACLGHACIQLFTSYIPK